eukprot:260413_1
MRSGGHQYSGLSSCHRDRNGKCIQIDLRSDYFSHLQINHNVGPTNRYQFEYTVNVGPGVPLTKFYPELNKKGIFIGGGMCEGVQSSGNSYIERGFGALQDYIIEFQIVLSDGSINNIIKPDTLKWKEMKLVTSNNLHKYNDNIFYAVIGGGPGSWGIV